MRVRSHQFYSTTFVCVERSRAGAFHSSLCRDALNCMRLGIVRNPSWVNFWKASPQCSYITCELQCFAHETDRWDRFRTFLIRFLADDDGHIGKLLYEYYRCSAHPQAKHVSLSSRRGVIWLLLIASKAQWATRVQRFAITFAFDEHSQHEWLCSQLFANGIAYSSFHVFWIYVPVWVHITSS